MVKYEIIKNGMDDYTLKYKDKEVRFHSRVGIVNELQSVNKKARLKMIKELQEEGLTIKDLVVETKQGEKTIMDHSNKDFLEESYINETQAQIFLEALEQMLGMKFEDLIKELEIKTEQESGELATKLGECLIPSNERIS